VITAMNLSVPYNVGKLLSGSATGSFSRTRLHGNSYTPQVILLFVLSVMNSASRSAIINECRKKTQLHR
jgi:hypothetical protein